MRDLSIFIDESGGQYGHSKYCLVTLVLHEQDDSIGPMVARYEEALRQKQLPDEPFHASPLLYGIDDYRRLDHETRHKMLAAFFVFAKNLPVRYATFAYKRSEVASPEAFTARLKKDLVALISDHLAYFQGFDEIKIYYDNGQRMVSKAIHGAIDFMLSKQAVFYRKTKPGDYRLFQVADFLCTVELTAEKYARGEETATDRKAFGTARDFQRKYLRQLRRLRMN